MHMPSRKIKSFLFLCVSNVYLSIQSHLNAVCPNGVLFRLCNDANTKMKKYLLFCHFEKCHGKQIPILPPVLSPRRCCFFYCVGDMIKANKRANNVCILSDEAFCVSLPEADTNIGTFETVDGSNSISLFCPGCVATERRAMPRTMVCRHIVSFDFVSIYLFDLILDSSHFFISEALLLALVRTNNENSHAIQQARQSCLTIELIPKRIVRPIVQNGQLSINGVVLHLCRD